MLCLKLNVGGLAFASWVGSGNDGHTNPIPPTVAGTGLVGQEKYPRGLRDKL